MEVTNVFQVNAKSTGPFLSVPGLGLYVPAYQRSYSWGSENIDRLVQDIIEGVIRCDTNPDAMTFLGTLIQVADPHPSSVHPKVKTDLPKGVRLVIDGQQRLTTILLMNICLREEIKSATKKLPNNLVTADRDWFTKQSLRLQQALLRTISDQMPGGDEGLEHYPRIIRAHVDTWSSSTASAKYDSPIARLLHEYAQHANNTETDKRQFPFSFEKGRKLAHREFYQALSRLRNLIREIAKANGKRWEADDFDTAVATRTAQENILGDVCPELGPGTAELVRLMIVGTYLQDRVCVTEVTVTEEDYAFDMFEALNTTGEPLTAYETLRPRIIEAEGLSDYGQSDSKAHIDHIDKFFEALTQAQRRKITARIITFFALAESGYKRGRKLSEQRRYLRSSYPSLAPEERLAFIAHFRFLVDFFSDLWEQSEDVSRAWNHLIFDNDEEASLAMRALSAAKHEIAIAPLLQWYQAWDEGDKSSASAAEFAQVIKALAAFFAVWRLTHSDTANVDTLIRKIMKDGHPESGLQPVARIRRDGKPPDAPQLVSVLRVLLENDGITDKQSFVSRIAVAPVYERSQPHTRLLLLMAIHDAVADPETPGLLKAGTRGVNSMLNRTGWKESGATIEHIAPQRPGKDHTWDEEVYDGEGAQHRLGNLTLLPPALNASLSNQSWIHKRLIYRLVTSRTPREAHEIRKEAQERELRLPEDFEELHGYQIQLESIAAADNWKLPGIHERSKRLAELAWRTLDNWLSWSALPPES